MDYILTILVMFIISLFIKLFVNDTNIQNIQNYGCQNALNISDCMKHKITQIIFFSISIFHFFLMILMCFKLQKNNQGHWIIKIIVIIVLCLFLKGNFKSNFFENMQYISIWTANILYMLMVIVFINLAYSFEQYLQKKMERNKSFQNFVGIIILINVILCFYIGVTNFKKGQPFAIFSAIFFWWNLKILTKDPIAGITSLVNLINVNIASFIHDQIPKQYESYFLVTFLKIFFIFILLLGMVYQCANKFQFIHKASNSIIAHSNSQQYPTYTWIYFHFIMMIITFSIPGIFCQSFNANKQYIDSWLLYHNCIWWSSLFLFFIFSFCYVKMYIRQSPNEIQNNLRQNQHL